MFKVGEKDTGNSTAPISKNTNQYAGVEALHLNVEFIQKP